MQTVRQIVEEESAREWLRRHAAPRRETVSLRFLRRLLMNTPIKQPVELVHKKDRADPRYTNSYLIITTAYHHPERNRTYQLNFCSGSILAQVIRQWRNLYGAELVVDGKPAGKISYANPVLKELAR